MTEEKYDEITRPAHYCEGRTLEPMDVAVMWGLDFPMALALKYISRAGRKDSEVKDLKKAKYCLIRELGYMRRGREDSSLLVDDVARDWELSPMMEDVLTGIRVGSQKDILGAIVSLNQMIRELECTTSDVGNAEKDPARH